MKTLTVCLTVWLACSLSASAEVPSAGHDSALYPCLGADAGKSYAVACKPVTNMVLLWQTSFAYKGNHPILQPVVGPGGKEVFLGAKGTVFRLEAATGKITAEWKGDYLGEITLADGRLYVAGSKSLYALDPQTGKVIWESLTDKAFYIGHYAYSPVEVTRAGDLAFFGKGMTYKDPDNGLYAVMAADGKRAWRAALNVGETIVSSVAVEGDRSVCLISNPRLEADGTPIKFKFHYRIQARDTKDGRLVWEYPLDCVNALGGFGPSIKDGVVYGSDTAAVFALSAADGKVIWKKGRALQNGRGKNFCHAMVLAGDLVITAVNDIEAFSRKDGATRWDAKGYGDVNFMAAADGVLYVGRYGLGLRAYDVVSGKELWMFEAPEIPGNPKNAYRNCRGLAVADGRVYYTTYQGVLFCLGQRTPRLSSSASPTPEAKEE